MIKFLYPEMFLLLAFPWLIRLIFPPVKGLHGDALHVPFLKDIANINLKSGILWQSSGSSQKSLSLNMLLLLIIWLLLTAAMARPQWLGEPIKTKDYGRDILLVMDISTSMREPDFVFDNRRIDRLSAVKVSADNFIKQRTNDRVGLVLFGTRAYLQSPITFDKKSVGEILWSMDAGMAGNSTAIGDALGLALKTLKESGNTEDKVIILLTDGENNDGSLTMPQAINLVKNEKVKIYTIGVGSKNAFFDSFFGMKIANPQSGIDEDALKQLAEDTKGKYYRATDTAGLLRVYQEIDRLEPSLNEDQYVQESKDLFYFPLTSALLLSLLLLFLQKRGLR